MSDSQTFGFAKLVPGFDFLQNLAKGAGGGLPQMTQLSSWIAPTLNVEELDKRIQDLRAVHFWLEQNGKALAATIQALEVQKMTLSTLQGMNLSMNELAESMKLTPDRMSAAFSAPPGAPPAAAADASASSPRKSAPPASAAKPEDSSAGPAGDQAAGQAAGKSAGKSAGRSGSRAAKPSAPAAAPVDPLQWWGALSEQFQQIAASALQDVAQAGASPAPSAPAASRRKSGKAAAGAARKGAASPAAAPSSGATRSRRNPAKPRGRGASAA